MGSSKRWVRLDCVTVRLNLERHVLAAVTLLVAESDTESGVQPLRSLPLEMFRALSVCRVVYGAARAVTIAMVTGRVTMARWPPTLDDPHASHVLDLLLLVTTCSF